MKRKVLSNAFAFSAIAMLLFIAYSCSDSSNTTTPPAGLDANSINGTVLFADTNFGSASVGNYNISAFTSWPPSGPPSANVNLTISKVGSVYQGTYKITAVNNGIYFIAVGWRRLIGGASPVMGIYGCDTMHYMPPANTCPRDTAQMNKAIISGNAGISLPNFLTWADTTKRIF